MKEWLKKRIKQTELELEQLEIGEKDIIPQVSKSSKLTVYKEVLEYVKKQQNGIRYV